MRVILIVDWCFINGGQAKVALDTALALKAAGHDVVLFSAVGPADPALAAAGIEVHCIDQPEFVGDPNRLAAAWRAIDNRVAARKLHELLKAQPRGNTVVHVHGWHKALSASIAGALRAAKLPVLYTMHEYFLVCPNGGFYIYEKQAHCQLKPLSAACLSTYCDTRGWGFKFWRAARLGAAKYWHRLPDVLADIAYFHPFQRALIEKHLPPATRLHEIPNPIETVELGPKPDPTSGDIIFVGRLNEEKGVFLYAEGMRRAGLAPVFVGDGPAGEALRAQYPESRFLGWHDAAGVRERLRAARALVFPSLWYEGQPLTVLESLSLGTPVIVSDGCAGRESVADGATGFWFRHGDPADLARAITALTDDPMVRRLAGEAYRRYWARPFTMERHRARLEEVYAGLLVAA